MKYTDLTKEKWNTFHYNNGMTDLENFLVRMIVKFYHTHPSHAEDAFSGLYNYICSEWLTASVEHEQEQEQEQEKIAQSRKAPPRQPSSSLPLS